MVASTAVAESFCAVDEKCRDHIVVLPGNRAQMGQADPLQVGDRVGDLGWEAGQADPGQCDLGLGQVPGQDRRGHAQAGAGVRAPPQPVQADDLGDAAAGALEVLDEVQERGRRGVVDQRHQVGDVQVDGRAAAGDLAPGLASRCRELKQTSGRPKYRW